MFCANAKSSVLMMELRGDGGALFTSKADWYEQELSYMLKSGLVVYLKDFNELDYRNDNFKKVRLKAKTS